MKDTARALAWQWRCDFCFNWYGPRAFNEQDLPTYEQMIAGGWSIGKVHGDVCPKCLAGGVQPRSERHSANGEAS